MFVRQATEPQSLVAQHLFMVVPGVGTPDLSSPAAHTILTVGRY